jgi:hypothetical protein
LLGNECFEYEKLEKEGFFKVKNVKKDKKVQVKAQAMKMKDNLNGNDIEKIRD